MACAVVGQACRPAGCQRRAWRAGGPGAAGESPRGGGGVVESEECGGELGDLTGIGPQQHSGQVVRAWVGLAPTGGEEAQERAIVGKAAAMGAGFCR